MSAVSTIQSRSEKVSQIGRRRRLYSNFQSGGKGTAVDLDRDLGVTKGTVLRDIEFLREQDGVIIDYVPSERRYNVVAEKVGITLSIGAGELVALYAGISILDGLGGTYHAGILRRACEAVAHTVHETISIDLTECTVPITFAPLQTLAPSANIMLTVEQSLNNKVTLEIVYDSPNSGKITDPFVDTVHIHCRFGLWYLIAWCHNHEEHRLFRFDMILSAKLTDQNFAGKGFNAEEYLGNSFDMFRSGDPIDLVRTAASTGVRWFRERRFHHTKTIEQQDVGSALVRMHVVLGPDLEQWILGWSEQVEVLEPSVLRVRVGERLNAACRSI